MINKLFAISFLWLCIIGWSCNKPTDLTSFLDEPVFQINHTNLDFNLRTIGSDSVQTFNDSTFTSSYFVGRLQDPHFGEAAANLHLQFGINREPDFTMATFDSLVLTIAYDTTLRQYGPVGAPLDLEIFEITEDLSRSQNYYSSTDVMIDPNSVGEITGLIPNYTDTIYVLEPQSIRTDTVAYLPHIRIPLTEELGLRLLSFELSDFASVETFLEKFKGLSIRPKTSCEGMTFFDISTGLTRMNLYYTQNDTARLMQFALQSSNVAFNTYEHNFTGSPVGEALQDDVINDSILYVQSMQGPNILIELTDLTSLTDQVINYAELTLYQYVPEQADTINYVPIPQMRLDEQQDDGTLTPVVELIKYGGNRVESMFMGNYDLLDETLNTRGYKFNITEHIQNIISGEATNKIVLSNFYSGTEPYRSILLGKSSSDFSASIKVTFSDTTN